jgi:hypothetical protein
LLALVVVVVATTTTTIIIITITTTTTTSIIMNHDHGCTTLLCHLFLQFRVEILMTLMLT